MMSREAIEVGSFTWSRIQRLHEPDTTAHWQRCESEGLQCPQEVFTQLFHEQSNNEDFAVIVRSIDWGRVRWGLQEISAVALRHAQQRPDCTGPQACVVTAISPNGGFL